MGNNLLMSSFGGLLSYLRSLLLVDTTKPDSMLTQAQFMQYDPMREGSCLMLDGQTLQNLDILENSVDGSEHGTLFALLCQVTKP